MSHACRSVLILCLALFAFANRAAPAQVQPPTQPPAQSQAPTQAQAPTQGPVPAGYSAPSLYNLANSFARAGKPGLAVLNYERARLLDPKDPDIDANLRRVRESSGLPTEPVRVLDRLARIFSPSIVSLTCVLGLLIAGVSMLARAAFPARR